MINLKDKIKQEKEMKQPQRKASFRSQLLARGRVLVTRAHSIKSPLYHYLAYKMFHLVM